MKPIPVHENIQEGNFIFLPYTYEQKNQVKKSTKQ